jgi:hypothetical protein
VDQRPHVTLYRPTGLDELGLMYDLGLRAFPPRLPQQPIFYPVTTLEYATAIARDWNVKSPKAAGFVTQFSLDETYAASFQRHIVGGREHEELWVPAEQLTAFNSQIIGPVEVVAAFFGENYAGVVPAHFMLEKRSVTEQLALLSLLYEDYPMDFQLELRTNQKPIWLNYPFWTSQQFDASALSPTKRVATLRAIREDWPKNAPPLPDLSTHA